jgi:SAM-dependent methyltransferase
VREMFRDDLIYREEGDLIYDFIGDYDDDYLANYEEISRDFDGRVSTETMVLSNLCEVLVPVASRVLDVGCGRGYVLNNLDYMGEQVGLDVSRNELMFIPEDSGVVKVRAFGEDMPFVSRYFDVVLCLDVLEHVRDPDKLASELSRVLRFGGMLLLACPWKQDLSVYETEEYKQNYKQYKYRHLRSIDYNLVERLFRAFDLEAHTFVVAHRRFQTLNPYSIRFMKLVKYRDEEGIA